MSKICKRLRNKLDLMKRYVIRTYNTDYNQETESWFSHVKLGPRDPILGLAEVYKMDENPNKINLGVGAYRDDNGKPFVLPCVRAAEKYIYTTHVNHEYSPIGGPKKFTDLSIQLALGKESRSIDDKRYATVQTISGTGALRIGAAFLNAFWTGPKEIYMPVPTWGNHGPIFKQSGLKINKYRYYHPETRGLDFNCCLEDIQNIPAKSIVLFHACAHNPTGVDLNEEQWCELSNVMKERKLYPFFDMAYQGFATGSIDNDAMAIRIFENEGHSFMLAQSYSKNMGLYGERIGACSIICQSSEEADRVLSQLKIIIRAMYSNPPIHGARLVTQILGRDDLRNAWLDDVKGMADRIITVRQLLKDNLIKLGSSHSWDHITNQIGMFCYTGMNAQNVKRLIQEYSIYLTKDGRISVAAVTSQNVDYLAQAIYEVTK